MSEDDHRGEKGARTAGPAPHQLANDVTVTAQAHRKAARAGAVADHPGRSLEEGARIGRFTVIRELGAGGMGVVMAAYDPKLDRNVAVKLLKPTARGQDRDGLQMRLMREARALAKLNHPNVIAIHDVGSHGDEIFIAEELVDGGDLRAWLAETPRSWSELLDVFRQAGRALAAAHAAGIIHRDIKPGNVVVDGEGRVRVLDFGLAKRIEDVKEVEAVADTLTPDLSPGEGLDTRTGTVLGTPLYMSPEQHLRQDADEQSDLFSFCVTFYEALYGEPPFAGDSLAALERQVTQGKVRDAPADSRVPGWVRRVLLRGLRVTPDERYPTMNALLDALSTDPAATRKRTLVVVGIAVTFALLGAVALFVFLRGTGALDRGAATLADARPEEVLNSGEKLATQYWRQATAQYDLGNYAAAIELYEKGYEAAPAPFFLYNIGQAYRRADDCQNAIRYYRTYLARARYAAKRDEKAEGHVQELIDKLLASCDMDEAAPAPVR